MARIGNFSISDGNRKTGAIPAFSLQPGKTCSEVARKTCFVGGCYACKSYRMYPRVRKAWDKNLEAVLRDLDAFEAAMNVYFDGLSAPRFFRVHVSGDFFSREYAMTWARIARRHPGTRFLAFSKQWANIRDVDFPDNFSIVPSGWKDTDIPEDIRDKWHVAHCIEKGEAIPENCIECPGNCETCGMCWYLNELGRDVAFHKH